VLAVYVSLAAFHLSILVGPSFSDAADQPASPGQLQALSNQIAGLRAQRQAAEKDLAEWQALRPLAQKKLAADQAKLQGLLNPVSLGVQAGIDTLKGVDKTATTGDIGLKVLDAKNDIDNDNKILRAISDNEAQLLQKIAGLDGQIEQLQATLNYSKDPLAADLANERARLRNLEKQKPTKDDEGQLQREIDSERQRIKELEQEWNKSQPGSQTTTSSQPIVPQGPYGAPSSGFGPSGSTQPAGQQGQQPGYAGPDTGSPQVPYGPILEGIQGSIGGKPGMSKPGGG
jgi:hypothetical protein